MYHCLHNNRDQRARTIPRWLLAFLLFFLVALLGSLGGAHDPEIAVFKLITFAVGTLGALALSWDRNFDVGYSYSWFYTIYLLVVFVSTPLVIFSVGYYPNSPLFEGIFNQSQAYGVYVAPFTALLVICWLTGQFTLTRLGKLGCILGLATLYISNCRTAGYAVLISLLFVYLCGFLRRGAEARLLARHLLPLTIILLILFIIDLLAQGHVGRMVVNFVNKNGDVTTSVLASREQKVQDARAGLYRQLAHRGRLRHEYEPA